MRIAVSRQRGAEREVSPLELFFDLVYVFAISQLSHDLVAQVDARTGRRVSGWTPPGRLVARSAAITARGRACGVRNRSE